MKNRYQIGQYTALVGLIVNILLSALKLFAGILARSTAMIADALHSISDILATLVVLFSFRIAGKPEDAEHPYGHEKAEPIAAKILAIFLFVAGLTILWGALRTVFGGTMIVPGKAALYAAILSILVKEGLYRYVSLAAKRIRSTALKAEAWHHRSDALSSIGTLIGITAARMGFPVADPLAALLVSIMILRIAYTIYKKSIRELMDTAAPVATIEAIRNLILSLEKVKAVDTLKTRLHGSGIYADASILVDHFISVSDGHKIAREAEILVKERFSEVKDILIHIDPCDPSMVDCCNRCPHKCQLLL